MSAAHGTAQLLREAARNDMPNEVRRLLADEHGCKEDDVERALHSAIYGNSSQAFGILLCHAHAKGWLGNMVGCLIESAILARRDQFLRELMKTPADLAHEKISDALCDFMSLRNRAGHTAGKSPDTETVLVLQALHDMIDPQRVEYTSSGEPVPSPIVHKSLFDPNAIEYMAEHAQKRALIHAYQILQKMLEIINRAA